ncbi:recombinase RecT, partial [Mycolicibacterium goodii]|uniref:recombinase RecT n=1 Tax=Mycolicibacterium goodii TaxID=134601 RepID=UPI001BDC1EFD
WKERADGSRYKVERFVTKYTIQTGIDGYRKNGREAAKAYGDVLAFDGPWFTGEDDFHVTDDGEVIQHWRKVWPNGNPPHAARYVVYRNGEPFEGIAHFDEFVQTNAIYEGSGNQRRKVGEEPNSMWAKMPRNQIAKCAEALAWRRAYPDDFAGLILEDSAQPTVIDQDGNVESGPTSEKRRAAGGSGIGGVRAARERKQKTQRAADVVDGEVVQEATDVTQQETRTGDGDTNEAETTVEDTTADPSPGPQPTNRTSNERIAELRKSGRDRLNSAIFATFGELGLNGDDKRADRLVVIREIIRREIESTKELTDEELQTLRNVLISRKQAGTLDADVTEWLNLETIRQEAAAADAGAPEAPAGEPEGDE